MEWDDAIHAGQDLYGLSFRPYNASILKYPHYYLITVVIQQVLTITRGTYLAHASIIFIFLPGSTRKVDRT